MSIEKITLRWGAATDKGNVRDNNQDRYFANGKLFAVADGMGGHVGGEIAAQLTVDLLGHANSVPDLDTLVDLATQANVVVSTRSIEQPKLRGMGTTLCAIAVVRPSIQDVAVEDQTDDAGITTSGSDTPENHAAPPDGAALADRIGLVNIGDSRVYMERNSVLQQLTEDHSLVETLVRDGRLTSTEARAHPRRNVLTRAIGVESAIEVDAWEVVVEVGDRFLLCSDGLPTEVEFEAIQSLMARFVDPQQAAEELVNLAIENGGRDNITCVVVDVIDPHAPLTLPTPGIPGLMVPIDAEVTAATRRRRSTGSPTTTRLQGPNTIGVPKTRKIRVGWRIPLTLLVVVAIGVAAVGTLAWNFHRTYYIKVVAGRITVYRGDPSGLLWFKSRVVEISDIAITSLPKAFADQLAAVVEEPGLDAVHTFLTSVKTGIAEQTKAQTTPTASTTLAPIETSTSTTTTTKPGCPVPGSIVDPNTIATTTTTTTNVPPITGIDGTPITTAVDPNTTTSKPCP